MKNKKYIWLPAILLVYCLTLAWFNRETVTVEHKYLEFFGTLGLEIVVLAALVYFLWKRQKLKQMREDLDRRIRQQKENERNAE